jgi:hypothetical protein
VGVPTTVACDGPVVRVLVVGDTLSCTATDPAGRRHTFAVRIVDESGGLDLTLE